MEKYVAHRNEFTGSIQTVKVHCENTAELCRKFSIPELKRLFVCNRAAS